MRQRQVQDSHASLILPDHRQLRQPVARRSAGEEYDHQDSRGRYIAALCMNVDLTLFRGLQNVLEQFGLIGALLNISRSITPANGEVERLSVDAIRIQPIGGGAETIRARIDQFAAQRATTPRALKATVAVRSCVTQTGQLPEYPQINGNGGAVSRCRARPYTTTRDRSIFFGQLWVAPLEEDEHVDATHL